MSATQSGSTSSEYFSHLSDCVPTRDGAASNSANDDADASARRRAPDGARETNAVQRESAASARSRILVDRSGVSATKRQHEQFGSAARVTKEDESLSLSLNRVKCMV